MNDIDLVIGVFHLFVLLLIFYILDSAQSRKRFQFHSSRKHFNKITTFSWSYLPLPPLPVRLS